MKNIYPFKFLESYTKDDGDFFFGRETEVDELYKMIFKTRIMVVYGTSGTGKTSLIQCGLANKFNSYDWLDLNVRRGSNILASLDKKLCEHSDGVFTYVNNHDKGVENLSAKIEEVYKASFRPIYLIFDQFEELYVEGLGTALEQKYFIKAIKEILSIDRPIKIILSIREEYLGHLYEFEKEVPQLLRRKLRVEPMSLEKVSEVIKGINDFKESMVKVKPDEIEEITNEIFTRLKGKKEKSLTIQLPYLQVFLDKLYMKITNDPEHETNAVISLEHLTEIGEFGDVMQDFLERQVKEIAKKLNAKNKEVSQDTIWSILSNFSTLEGTKKPISKTKLIEKLELEFDVKLINSAVNEFVDNRILREVKDEEDKSLFELWHDSLALKIADKRSSDDIAKLEVLRLVQSKADLPSEYREFLTEKQLFFIKGYESKLKKDFTADEKKLISESKAELKRVAKEKRKREKEIKSRLERKRKFRNYLYYAGSGILIIILLIRGFIGQRELEESRVHNSFVKYDTIMTTAQLTRDKAAFLSEKNPTLSLQYYKQALDNLKKINTEESKKNFKNEQYGLFSRFNDWLHKIIDSKFDTLEKYRKLKIEEITIDVHATLEKDLALYKIEYPINKGVSRKDSLFNLRNTNIIFPEGDVFRVWSIDNSVAQAQFDTLSVHKISQIVFPESSNEAMVLYKGGTAKYFGTKPFYRELKMDFKRDKIYSIAPINYQKIGYKMLTAMNRDRIIEWNLNGTKRESVNKNKDSIVVQYFNRDNDFNDKVVSIAISKDRSRIFTGSDKGIGIIWEADTAKVRFKNNIARLEKFNLLQDTIKCSVFSNDGKFLATGSRDNTVKLWSTDSIKLIKILYGHSGAVTSVAFSKDNRFLYTGSIDGKFMKWKLPANPLDGSKWNDINDFEELFEDEIIAVEPDISSEKIAKNTYSSSKDSVNLVQNYN